MGRGRPRHPDILTPREWEVLALVREGLTNPEIAERLGITLPGARYHVSEILSKLNVSTREEAAAWQPATPPSPRRWGLALWAKAALGAAAIGIIAALGLHAWGVLSESSDGEAVSSAQHARIVYLAPSDSSLWLGTPDQLAEAEVVTVFSGDDLVSAVDSSTEAVVVDRELAAGVDADWLVEMRGDAKVIAAARMNVFDLVDEVPPPELEPSGPATSTRDNFDFYQPPQVYYTLYRLGESCSGGAQGLAGVSDPAGFSQFISTIARHAGRTC